MELSTPLTKEKISELTAGDSVLLSGTIATARDKAHLRALERNQFPLDLKGIPIFHAGPLVKKKNEEYEIVAVGPTTSSRMDSLEEDFLRKFQAPAVIGKGGMNPDIFKKTGSVYLAMTGGCAASAASKIKEILNVHWLDLSLPEAVWVLRIKDLPLLVGVDSEGNSVFD